MTEADRRRARTLPAALPEGQGSPSSLPPGSFESQVQINRRIAQDDAQELPAGVPLWNWILRLFRY